MKKIFTFMAAALMAATAFAAKETVFELNFAEYAATHIGTIGGDNITPNYGEAVNNYYYYTVDGLMGGELGNKVGVNRKTGLLRYSDIRTIGLFFNATPTFLIKGDNLQAGDVIEVAWNVGGTTNPASYYGVDTAFTSVANLWRSDELGTYTMKHTSGGTMREIEYTTRQMTVVKTNADARFAIPATKGDGSNWKICIAYIKVIRGEDDPEPEVEYEAQMDVNFAAYAASKIGTLGGSNITPTFGEQVNKVNTNVYSISVEGLLEAEKLFVNRNSDMLVRYSDVRSIGLYSKSTPTFVIPDLKKDDIVEIAWNAGGKSDGTYYTIDSTLTSLANIAVTGEWGEYAFTHTSGGTERTINYSTRQLKVAADGDVRFAIPSVKGDGSNWKIYIAYIKVLREKEQGPGTPTAIDDVKEASKAVKTIENGQVIILRDGVKYNLLGTRL